MTDSNKTTTKGPRYEACSLCGGAGVKWSFTVEDVVSCRSCGGAGRVIARDAHGRFLPWETVEATNVD